MSSINNRELLEAVEIPRRATRKEILSRVSRRVRFEGISRVSVVEIPPRVPAVEAVEAPSTQLTISTYLAGGLISGDGGSESESDDDTGYVYHDITKEEWQKLLTPPSSSVVIVDNDMTTKKSISDEFDFEDFTESQIREIAQWSEDPVSFDNNDILCEEIFIPEITPFYSQDSIMESEVDSDDEFWENVSTWELEEVDALTEKINGERNKLINSQGLYEGEVEDEDEDEDDEDRVLSTPLTIWGIIPAQRLAKKEEPKRKRRRSDRAVVPSTPPEVLEAIFKKIEQMERPCRICAGLPTTSSTVCTCKCL